MPSTARPPDTWSSVAAIFASRPGLRNVLAVPRWPIVARRVIAAAAAATVHPSSFGSDGAPSSHSRWSSNHGESSPASSAAPIAARSDGQSVSLSQKAAPSFMRGGVAGPSGAGSAV